MKIANINLWDNTKNIHYSFIKDCDFIDVWFDGEYFQKRFFDEKNRLEYLFYLLDKFKRNGYKVTYHRNYKIKGEYYSDYDFSLD